MSLQRFSARREVSDGHHVVDSGARLALVKGLASLDPHKRASALTNRSVERGPGSYVMADENSVHQQECDAEANDSPSGRQMDLRTAAAYLGCSYWTLRELALNGHIPAVRIPSPRARDARVVRRILIDSRDLERLIERWKEVAQLHP